MDFLLPYAVIIFTGSHSLIQVLEEFNIISTSNGIALFDYSIFKIYMGLYIVALIPIFFLNIISSFALSTRLTFILLLLWSTPYILHVTEIINFTPKQPTFVMGGTVVTSIGGILINALFVVILSWSISTILLHLFKSGKRFKALYDHIWYLFSLSALIFFIIDLDTDRFKQDLSHTEKELSRSIDILHKQTKIVQDYCKEEKFKNYFPTTCQWIKPANYYVDNLNFRKKFIMNLDNKPTFDIWAQRPKKLTSKEQLEKELNILNSLCKHESFSEKCIEIPSEFKHQELLKDSENIFEQYILPAKELMLYISDSWEKAYMLQQEEREVNKLPAKKWFFFMLTSLIIGIRLSISTREIFGGKEYSVYWAGIKRFFKLFWQIIMYVIMLLQKILMYFYNQTMDIKRKLLKYSVK